MSTDTLPAFDTDRTAWGGAGNFTAPVHLLTLHTTEGDGFDEALRTLHANHDEPTVLTEMRASHGRKKLQLVSASKAAKALRNAAGGVETNRDGTLQIEIVGFAAHPEGATADDYRWLGAEVVGPMCKATGIPLIAPIAFHPYPPVGARLGSEPWRTCPNGGVRGIVGHQHWVENVHGDPGDYSSKLFEGGTKSAMDLILEGAGAAGHPAVKAWAPPPYPLPRNQFILPHSTHPAVGILKVAMAGTKYGKHLDLDPLNYYDDVLKTAVEHLQADAERNAGLPVRPDGIVGPQTWLWLSNILLVNHALSH